MDQYINKEDLVMTINEEGIMSGGFSIGSILLKKQLAGANEDSYRLLQNTSIPVGLLYGGKTDKHPELDLLKDFSEVIDTDVYLRLLSDFSLNMNKNKNKKIKRTIRERKDNKKTKKMR